MKFKDYSELTLYVEEHDDVVECILGYDDWSVVKVNNTYWYYEHPVEGSSDVFYEVVPAAIMRYDITSIVSCELFEALFECDMSGEQVTDNGIYYWWFIKKGVELCEKD